MKTLAINKHDNKIKCIYENYASAQKIDGIYLVDFDGYIPYPSIGHDLYYDKLTCAITVLESNNKEYIRTKLYNEYEAKLAELKSGYTNMELSTWDRQLLEASSYLKDTSALTPLLDAICASRGCSKDYLSHKIVDKSTDYLNSLGTLLGELKVLDSKIV